MKSGYARVSADDPKAEMQRAALKKAGCGKIFTDDGISEPAPENSGERPSVTLRFRAGAPIYFGPMVK